MLRLEVTSSPPSPARPLLGPGLSAFVGLVTLVALLLVCQTRVRSLQRGFEYPLMSRPDPTRALFVHAEKERRVAQSGVIPRWLMASGDCAVCSAAALERRWDELFDEHRQYLADGYRRHAGTVWLREAKAARDISLAGWGDPARIEAIRKWSGASLPDYLIDRCAEILRGDRDPERSLAKREAQHSLTSLGVELAFMLCALALLVAYQLGYRCPRRAARSRLAAPELGRGLIVFIWAKGFLTRSGWFLCP